MPISPHSEPTSTASSWHKTVADEGIRRVGPQVEDRNVGLYLVHTDEHGERDFVYYRKDPAATTLFGAGWREEFDLKVAEADLVYLSTVTLQILGPEQRERLRTALECARANGAAVAFDANLRRSDWSSADEARREIERTAQLCTIAFVLRLT